MNTTTFQLETLTCPSCITKIEKAVSSMKDVESLKVMFNASKVRVDSRKDIADEVTSAIEGLGYKVLSVEK